MSEGNKVLSPFTCIFLLFCSEENNPSFEFLDSSKIANSDGEFPSLSEDEDFFIDLEEKAEPGANCFYHLKAICEGIFFSR